MKSRTLHTILLLILPAGTWAFDPVPITYPYTYSNVYPAVYDTDGKMGVIVGTEVQDDPDYNYTNVFDGPMPLFRLGETSPFAVARDEILFNNNPYGLAAGDPYYFRMETQVGSVCGASTVGAAFPNAFSNYRTTQPIVFIPFSSSALGKAVRPIWEALESDQLPGEDLLAVNTYALLGDSLTGPSVGLPVFALPGIEERRLTVKLEWLQGNTKFGDPPYVFDGLNTVGGIEVIWTNDDQLSRTTNLVHFPPPVPAGPIKATYHLDGFTTDTITFTASNRKTHQLVFLTISDPESANPGQTPEQIGAPVTLQERAAADAILFNARPMKGIPADTNGDGVKDAADAIGALIAK